MIVAVYTIDKSKTKQSDLCTTCRYKDRGCEMRGRHIDSVDDCFMFQSDKVKKEGKK